MTRRPRILLIATAAAIAAAIGFLALANSGLLRIEVWERDTPLTAPITVTAVRDGALTLADGRALRPAGITRADTVSAEDFDRALRVITAQGVTITRDLGDGRAFLGAEPRFYNWCGTRGDNGNPWARCAGWYIQCPISELLIQSAYADPALDQPGLTPHERWRLEGVEHFNPIAERPTTISEELVALEVDGYERLFSVYDELLEAMWKPPPAP